MNDGEKNNRTAGDPELEGKAIAPLGRILEAHPIFEGESGERKYRVHFYGYDASYLLRLFDESSFAAKQAEFEALHKMQSISVHCSRPIAMGRWEAEGLGFQLLSYIEGEDAVRALSAASKPQQLRVGIQAGEELRRIGSYDAPEELEPWAERYRRCTTQTLARIESEKELPDWAQAAVRKVRNSLTLADNRPSVFRHGRYLPSNLIVKSGRLAGVVGFGHFDWGDPVYDFAMLGVCGRHLSSVFCTGQILGYHGGQAPEAEFWQLYSLYSASGALSLLAHSLDEAPEKLGEAIARIDRLARDHEGFSKDLPSWFGFL